LGDVVVNKEQAQRQCKEYGNSVEEEIADLVGHGVLHLLGIYHEDHEVSEDKK
jgi:probable rRNA maturation factor